MSKASDEMTVWDVCLNGQCIVHGGAGGRHGIASDFGRRAHNSNILLNRCIALFAAIRADMAGKSGGLGLA